jgi:hypothetical protein
MEDQYYEALVNSYGGRAVGLSFNPSNLLAVQVTKTSFAELINEMDQSRSESQDSEVKRMFSIAITELQTAQMWAVKALTWEKK